MSSVSSHALGVLAPPAVLLAKGAAEWLGIEGSLRLGEAFGRLWSRLGGPRTIRVRTHLARAFPEGSSDEVANLERRVFAHLGRGLAELVLMLGRHRSELVDRVEIRGFENLSRDSGVGEGLGTVVVAPHLGNWELAAAKLAVLGVPISLVYRGSRQAVLGRALRDLRAGESEPLRDKDSTFEPIEQIEMGPRAGVQFLRALQAGRNVLVLLDQHASEGEGRVVQFFDQPARTRVAPLKLAARIGAPVLFGYARRDPDGERHVLTLSSPLDLVDGGDRDEEVLRENVQRVTAEIERVIRESPEQWIWTHRRWRTKVEEASRTSA